MDTDNFKAGEGYAKAQVAGENDSTDVGHCRNCDMDFKFDQLIVEDGVHAAPVDVLDTKTTVTVELEFMEGTMRNLVMCLGGKPVDIDSNTEPGTLIWKPTGGISSRPAIELVYDVPQVKDKTKMDIYTFYKMKSLDGVKLSHRKGGLAVFKAKFLALADTGNQGAPYQIQYNAENTHL